MQQRIVASFNNPTTENSFNTSEHVTCDRLIEDVVSCAVTGKDILPQSMCIMVTHSEAIV